LLLAYTTPKIESLFLDTLRSQIAEGSFSTLAADSEWQQAAELVLLSFFAFVGVEKEGRIQSSCRPCWWWESADIVITGPSLQSIFLICLSDDRLCLAFSCILSS
jgi:hypothetical protein